MGIPVLAPTNTAQVPHPVSTKMVILALQAKISTAPVAAVKTKIERRINIGQINTVHLLININTVQAQAASIPHQINIVIKRRIEKEKRTRNIVPAVEKKKDQVAKKKTWMLIKKKSAGKERKRKGENAKNEKEKRGKKEKPEKERVRKVKISKLKVSPSLQSKLKENLQSKL